MYYRYSKLNMWPLVYVLPATFPRGMSSLNVLWASLRVCSCYSGIEL